jgi:uncharacterized protein YbbC (DUF1343 family)
VDVVVLDRPNPINGENTEGPVLERGFESFVGRYPIPIRHGMTMGELALLFNQEFRVNCNLEVISMEGWRRSAYFEDTELPWVLPSPNMPTVDTAIVYPGMCLLEATNVSEGRGTTRPFEIFGAPWIEPDSFYVREAFRLKRFTSRPSFVLLFVNRKRLAARACMHRSAFFSTGARSNLHPIGSVEGISKSFRWKEPP